MLARLIILASLTALPTIARAERSVRFNGTITQDTLRNLSSNITREARKLGPDEPREVIIDLNSGGGLLLPALDYVHEINFLERSLRIDISTRVRSECESSCTVLFTAGARRMARARARFGFHSPKIESRVRRDQDPEAILEEFRRLWLQAVGRVDPTVANLLRQRNLLYGDNMRTIRAEELSSGYVSEIIR